MQWFLAGFIPIILGFLLISWNYFQGKKQKIYEDLNFQIFEFIEQKNASSIETPPVENVEQEQPVPPTPESPSQNYPTISYTGRLEIPKISLKKGFFNLDSPYNNVNQNVTVLKTSSMPDVETGNLILAAHSGDALISYFRYLYKLQVGDLAYVFYNNKRYEYQIVKIYNQEKNGTVAIYRDGHKTTLTLITCTYQSDTLQTVYIAELIKVDNV